jgi:hypothetical protein
MLRWDADEELVALVAHYYRGEAGLWQEIRARVHAELVRRGLPAAPRHIRLRRLDSGGYEVIVEDAAGYASE